MRRHPDLIPFSHHHHRALVAARHARVAGGGVGDLLESAREFLVFFEGRALSHFREEEERLFPLLLDYEGAEAPEELVRALLDHVRLHALAAQLRSGLAVGEVEVETLRRAGALLEAHVRLEERELFPLIELCAAARLEQALEAIPATRSPVDEGPVVDLARASRRGGPQWGMESEELNATLLAWPAGSGVSEHRNDACDVLLVALEGSAALRVDGADHELFEDELILLPRGCTRSLTAGPDGVRYLSIYRRRGPLLPQPRLAAVPEIAS
jgi:quercetin dioxygenase-like cupin family protein